MEHHLSDDIRKKEWQRLRNLRLRQVRLQSKQISKDILLKTEEKRQKKMLCLRAKREEVLEEWKQSQIKELEEKYNIAMEEVGLAAVQAQAEVEAEEIFRAKHLKNLERAKVRGKIANENELRRVHETLEKENAPIRRKQLTREVEDIRSGLVVQSRDWDVINHSRRKVLADLHSNMENLSHESVNSASRMSTKAQSLKTQRSPKASPSRPYPSTLRSPLKVPRLQTNLEECMSGESTSGRKSDLLGCDAATASNFPDITTYRIPIERPVVVTASKTTSPINFERNKPVTAPSILNDEEIDHLLQRYYPDSPSRLKRYSARSASKTGHLSFTPPTHDKDDSALSPVRSGKCTRRRRERVGNSNSETKKLFMAIDKALANGRRLRGEETKTETSSIASSGSESDEPQSEGVLKLIVNVNCGSATSDKMQCTPIPNTIVENRTFENPSQRTERDAASAHSPLEREPNHRRTTRNSSEKALETKNAATEVGDSLQGRVSTQPSSQSTDCSGSKVSCSTRDGASHLPQYFHYVEEPPIKRTSTYEDLSIKAFSKDAPFMKSLTDMSSITDETPPKNKNYRRFQKDSHGVSSDVMKKNDFTDRSASSTVYLKLPEDSLDESRVMASKEKESFTVNPVLDYYIRKLLDKPDKLKSSRSGECYDCPCTFRGSREYSSSAPQDPRVPLIGRPVVSDNGITTANRTKQTEVTLNPPSPDRHVDRLKRIEKIAELERQLAEVRRMRLLSSSSSDGRRSSDSSTSGSSDTEELEIPVMNHRLSTIMEVDSRLHDAEGEAEPLSVISDKIKQIYHPVQEAPGLATSTIGQESKLSDTNHFTAENNKSLSVPQLDFSSILSPRSSLAGPSHVCDDQVQASPRLGSDLSFQLSRIDLSWAKRM